MSKWPEKMKSPSYEKDYDKEYWDGVASGYNQAIDVCTAVLRDMDWPGEVEHDKHCPGPNGHCLCGADAANAMRSQFLAKINEITKEQ